METATQRITRWREHPVEFVRECFGVEPDAWQIEILEAFPKNQRLAMKACKGPGKTCVLAWLCWNFLCTRTHPKVAATSITSDNLSDGLWPEMSLWQNKSRFLKESFEWTKTRIFLKTNPETWWMSARTWPKGANSTQQADTLAGLHADNLLFVLDEAGGIPDSVMAAAEAGLATGKDTKILIAGNPTHLEGPLYRACTSERHMWFLVEITADPDDPKRTPRVKIQWAREQIEKYGRDNPWVLVNVFGQFPPSSMNSLLGPDIVRAAQLRHLVEDVYIWSQKRLGIDVARFGDDSTIIAPRQGLAAFNMKELKHARTQVIGGAVIKAKIDWGSEREYVDGTGGFGAGVVDHMITAGYDPFEIHFSSRADDQRFGNKRAEMWWLMAEWIKRGASLPDDPRLLRELTAPTYYFDKAGRIFIEAKEQIKARLGFSPDKADALALTFSEPEMTATIRMLDGRPVLGANRHHSEWNPYQEKPDENNSHQSDWNPFRDE